MTKPKPEDCTAVVNCTNGVITTKSCITKQPLIDEGSSYEGDVDYYTCPDCGKWIKIYYGS